MYVCCAKVCLTSISTGYCQTDAQLQKFGIKRVDKGQISAVKVNALLLYFKIWNKLIYEPKFYQQ